MVTGVLDDMGCTAAITGFCFTELLHLGKGYYLSTAVYYFNLELF